MNKRISKNILEKNNPQKLSIFSSFQKDIDTVLRLNFTPPGKEETNYLNAHSLSESKENNIISSENKLHQKFMSDINDNQEEKLRKYLDKFTISLKMLKNHYPNLKELNKLDIYTGTTPARIEHIKIENKIKKQISYFVEKKIRLKNNKHIIEQQILNIDNKIRELLSKRKDNDKTIENVTDNNNIINQYNDIFIKKIYHGL